jgi:RNA polymerase-binding transcription factor DksA
MTQVSSTERLDPVELDRFRHLLLRERSARTGLAGPLDGDGDAAAPGLDELDFLRYEQGMTAAVASLSRTALAEVDAALARIADGTFGRCVGCDGSIPLERLEAMPAALCCVSCQTLRE